MTRISDGVARVLTMRALDFLAACPDFRRWRLLRASAADGGGGDDDGDGGAAAAAARGDGDLELLSDELGPYDRLV